MYIILSVTYLYTCIMYIVLYVSYIYTCILYNVYGIVCVVYIHMHIL